MGEPEGPGTKDYRRGRDLEEAETVLVDRYSASLAAFLQEVAEALEQLGREAPELAVSMKKRPDEILSMLPQVLPFEQMSFLELQYLLPEPSKKTPGIRFWLEGPLHEKRLRAVLFEDTRAWDVSYDLEKLYTELGTFFLADSDIVARPAGALSGKPAEGTSWRAFLRAVLRVPIR